MGAPSRNKDGSKIFLTEEDEFISAIDQISVESPEFGQVGGRNPEPQDFMLDKFALQDLALFLFDESLQRR